MPLPTIRKDRRMSDFRTKGRRSPSRAFRPALDGRLEDRVLLSGRRRFTSIWELSSGCSSTPQAKVAFHANVPPFALNAPRWNREFRVIHAAASQTIRGGQAVNVVSVDGTHYRIQLGYISNTVQTAAGRRRRGNCTRRRHRRPRPRSSSPPSIPSRSAPSGSMPCRAARSASSWTARLPTPS